MAVQADMKYEATVLECFLTESKTQKTPAIYFLFQTEDGQIDHNLYITSRTVERARETMSDCFHVSPEEVSSMAELGDWKKVIGASVSISTIAEEYNGGEVVKVQWVNPAKFRPQKATMQAAKSVSAMFVGKSEPPAPNWNAPLDDETVPF